MNPEPKVKRDCGICAYAIAVVGAFLIVAGLVWVMYAFTRPEPLGEDRAALRRKNLAELRADNSDKLNNYGWQDQPKGIVRLPIEEAMKLAETKWHENAAAARADLIARVQKAKAPPPKAPEKPNPFD